MRLRAISATRQTAVQLDRHHLQAFQVIEAQYLLPLDRVVSHRIPNTDIPMTFGLGI
jgi:hypothetical protein